MRLAPKAFVEVVVEQSFYDDYLIFRCKRTKLEFRISHQDIENETYGRIPTKRPFNSPDWALWFRYSVLGSIYAVRKAKCESTQPSKKPPRA